MSAPLTEKDLFSALSGYASRLEVQFMIEEEVRIFQKKVLPQLLSQLSGASSSSNPTKSPTCSSEGGVEQQRFLMSSSSATAAPSHGTGTLNTEWVQMFLKAHADDVLNRQLPSMIALEVQRQLRRAKEDSQVGSAEAPPPSSPPRGESVAPTVTPQARVGLPPLPSAARPPLAPSRELTSSPAETSSAEKQENGERGLSSVVSMTHDEGRRQREQILNAIADMELELKDVQRDVDRITHEQQLSRRRLEYLCEVLGETDSCPTAGGEPASLCVALEKALDDRQAGVVRARLAVALQGLLPQRTALSPGRGTAVHDSGCIVYSSRSSVMPQDGVMSCGSLTSVVSYTTSPSAHDVAPPPLTTPLSHVHHERRSSSRASFGGVGTSPALTAYSSEISPVNGAMKSPRTVYPIRHVDAATSACSAAEHAASVSLISLRRITTRGTGASNAAAAADPSARFSLMQKLPVFTNNHSMESFPLCAFSEHSQTQLERGEAASLPAPLPRESIDRRTSKKSVGDTRSAALRHVVDDLSTTTDTDVCTAGRTHHSTDRLHSTLHHGASSPSRDSLTSLGEMSGSGRASRAVVLGVDAVNLPSGLVPGVLGRQGAVRVQSLVPQGVAARAGVCRGDVLLSVNNRQVFNCTQMRDVLAAVPAAQSFIPMEIYRQSTDEMMCVTLRL